MPDYPISLDESSNGYTLSEPSMPRKHYPCLNLSWKKSYDLPEDGTMVVKFHKKRETNTESDEGDSQSVELEILSIESVKADEPEEKEKTDRESAADALDKYAEEAGEDY